MENNKIITGLHIVGQIKTKAELKIESEKKFKQFLSRTIKQYDLRELGSYYYKFGKKFGFTGVVCLAESHIAIHTWPEIDYVTLDVFLCNYSKNNEEKCRKLFSDICSYFLPLSVDKIEVYR